MKFEDIINSEEKVKSFVILMVIGIILVGIFGIYSLITIWSPNADGDNQLVEVSLGAYELKSITQEEMAKTYFSNIFVDMYNEDYESLFKILDPLYVKENKVTVDKLRQYVQNNGMGGTDLVLEKYDVESIEGYRVYTLQVALVDKSKVEKIIVKEKSPKDITISFGNKLYYEDTGNKVSQDGLEYECISIEDAGTQITVKVNIKNISTNNIIINRDKQIYAVKAITDKNTMVNMVSDTLTGRTIELTPEQTFTYIGVFRKHDYTTIKGIRLESVINTKTGISINSTYEF